MKLKLIEYIKLTKEFVDREHFFTLGYCEALETHLMKVLVSWVAGYERYYRISTDDYALFEEDRPAFYELYKNELGEDNECFTQKFMGAQALRDYDGRKNFQTCYPSKEMNPFGHYAYYNGVLYAQILWDKGTVYVPPYQKVKTLNGTWDYPLRKDCYVEKDPEGKDLCFCLDTENEK
jgi:hypothetical protein